MPAKDPSDPDKDRHFVTALSRDRLGTSLAVCDGLEMVYHGFVLSIGVMHEHFNAVAVPIRSMNGGAVHGLSASGPASIWTREKLMEIGSELAALARDLSTVPASTSNQKRGKHSD